MGQSGLAQSVNYLLTLSPVLPWNLFQKYFGKEFQGLLDQVAVKWLHRLSSLCRRRLKSAATGNRFLSATQY